MVKLLLNKVSISNQNKIFPIFM